MNEDIKSLKENNTWVHVDRANGKKLVSCKWLFKLTDGRVEGVKFKVRLVALGFTKPKGIDYNKVFSPVVKHTSIRMMLSLVAQEDMELEQLDVRTVFLHGDIEEQIYMTQPEGFAKKDEEDKVSKLDYLVQQKSQFRAKVACVFRIFVDHWMYLYLEGTNTSSLLLMNTPEGFGCI